jgi:hypothetical protein
MSNEMVMTGKVKSSESITGDVRPETVMSGKVGVGGSMLQNAVLYVEQNLTDEQVEQARANIRVIGKSVTGMTFAPYTVDEANDYAYIYDDPIEAADGAEIFNSYGDGSEYGGDGNIAVGAWSQASGFKTQAVGNYSKAEGWWTRADGQCAVASGLLSIASGHFAHAEGTRTQATINNAHSEGDMTKATGRQSHSEGQSTTSSGFCSHAEGSATVSSGYYSHAEGWGTTAKGKNQTAMGKYNIADTTSLLIVGKGSKATPSNALTLNSSGNLWVSGTVASTGADYAEYFEWEDGNPDAEDRVGLAVTLDGDKIRLANDGDEILGIVSGTAMVLGDNYEHEWKDKYLTDVYGRIIYDEPVEEFVEYIDYGTGGIVKESTGFHVYPKLNPNYDSNRKYVGRAERKEWNAVGLIGKLHVNDDGTCVVGGYAKIGANGIVTASIELTNMRVMKRVADNVVLVLMK